MVGTFAAQKNGYCFIYLSSRSIGQAGLTRDYLQRLHVDEHKLPLGPVIISPDGLVPALYREMVQKRPHEFKIRWVVRLALPISRTALQALLVVRAVRKLGVDCGAQVSGGGTGPVPGGKEPVPRRFREQGH
jgi:hypothetical protein